jgi:hypothetical protein
MNRRNVIMGVGAAAAAPALLPLSEVRAANGPSLGVRLYEVADPAEMERIAKLAPWQKRRDFRIVHWHNTHSRPIEEIFNDLSMAGYSYVGCTFCDGIRGQYVFARSVPLEALS